MNPSELRCIAARIEASAQARAAQAGRARAGWSGPLRERFDAERARREAMTAALVARCRRVAAVIEAESDADAAAR
ncbi:MAG: hypothetical protein JWM89_824 [Acidimicrobiales bacterium]|nr:hypothetical protein [Acidimicrobiales bacterium]